MLLGPANPLAIYPPFPPPVLCWHCALPSWMEQDRRLQAVHLCYKCLNPSRRCPACCCRPVAGLCYSCRHRLWGTHLLALSAGAETPEAGGGFLRMLVSSPARELPKDERSKLMSAPLPVLPFLVLQQSRWPPLCHF